MLFVSYRYLASNWQGEIAGYANSYLTVSEPKSKMDVEKMRVRLVEALKNELKESQGMEATEISLFIIWWKKIGK